MKIRTMFSVKVSNAQGNYHYQTREYTTPKEALNAVRVAFTVDRDIKPEELIDYTYTLTTITRREHMKYPMSWKIAK